MTTLKSPSATKTSAIEARCAATGMRMTEQRRVIARVLAEAADHPDVEELYRRCVTVDDKISISTVYRTVKLFEDAGIIERHAVQLEPVIDQLVAELAGDLGLQLLDLLRGELDHLAVAQVDQMIVVAIAHLFVASAALAEIMPLDDAGVLEQLDRAIDRGDRNLVCLLYTSPSPRDS